MLARRASTYRMATSPEKPSVDLCIASYNTATMTELCIRSARKFAGYPFRAVVGDSGSTDGSREALSGLAERGWVQLEQRRGAQHAEWIDGWRRATSADLIVFADSDVEFRRHGWLREMVRQQVRTGAALVAAEMLGESHYSFNPAAQTTVRGMVRPGPWLIMLDSRQTAEIKTSFLYDEFESAGVPEGRIAYDVGARFYETVVGRGLATYEMPRRHRRTWHHYAGMSWIPFTGVRGKKKARDLRVAARRLRHLSRLQDQGALQDRIAFAVLAPPVFAELAEFGAHVRRRLWTLLRRDG
jgi:glycosyltransferase involved in cell wall biosynthesis